MKDLSDQLTRQSPSSISFENDFYLRYLKGFKFRGFWYDHQEKSYGITLSFHREDSSRLSLFAQDRFQTSKLNEYCLESDTFFLDQIAYDKILISLSVFRLYRESEPDADLSFPSTIEFSMQLLSQNSFYLQFLNHKQYSPPINKLRFGIVLARDSN